MKFSKKKVFSLTLASVMAASLLSGCGSSASGTASEGSSTADSGSGQTTAAPAKETKAKKGEKQVIEFWYHAADEKGNAAYQELIDELNASQDEYEYHYTGFANKDFPDKFQMAIATNTMPDVISTGFNSVMSYVAQGALVDISDYFDKWEEKDQILPLTVESLKNLAGGKLYGIPFNYDQPVSWYNKKLFDEKQIAEAPVTQKDFLKLCEEYADAANGNYFYSLRGVKPSDNLFSWIFTYTDGAGYKGSFFDENNQCILNKPEFAEALDAYANIYKNKWVSGDSVNNDFNEMVAEFGSGTAMYIMHNSSSRSSHLQTLGEGNFAQTKPLANDEGRYYAPAMQPQIYAVTSCHGADGNYDGAVKLVEFLAGKDAVSKLCQKLGRIPVNTACYETDWFKENPFFPLYQEIMEDSNYVQIQNPYWLTAYSNFIKNDMTTDFQAILLGEKTSQEVLDKWAEYLTTEQAEYLK